MKKRNKIQLVLALLLVTVGLFIAQSIRYARLERPITEIVVNEGCACLNADEAIRRHPENAAVKLKAVKPTSTFAEVTTLRYTTERGIFPFTKTSIDTINCVLIQKS